MGSSSGMSSAAVSLDKKQLAGHVLAVARTALTYISSSTTKSCTRLVEYGLDELDKKTFDSTVGVLGKTFVNAPADKRNYGPVTLVEYGGRHMGRSDGLSRMLRSEAFRRALFDLIDFGLARYNERYRSSVDGLALYEKYTRKDACRLLGWERDNSSTVYGYRVSYGTCPIFVTYHKSEYITSSTQYADEFENPRIFSWMTRSRLTLASPEVQKIVNAERDGLDMRLFIKKSDSEGADFYYFGRVRPVAWSQTSQPDDHGNRLPIVNFKLELEHPVQGDIYEYFGALWTTWSVLGLHRWANLVWIWCLG